MGYEDLGKYLGVPSIIWLPASHLHGDWGKGKGKEKEKAVQINRTVFTPFTG